MLQIYETIFGLFAMAAVATTATHISITIINSPVISLSIFVIPLMYWLLVIIRKCYKKVPLYALFILVLNNQENK